MNTQLSERIDSLQFNQRHAFTFIKVDKRINVVTSKLTKGDWQKVRLKVKELSKHHEKYTDESFQVFQRNRLRKGERKNEREKKYRQITQRNKHKSKKSLMIKL